MCSAGLMSHAHEQQLVLAVSEHAVAMLNRYPYAPGHVMVFPRRHVASIVDLQDYEYADLMKLVQTSVRAIDVEYQPDGSNIGLNLGSASGAGVPGHVHVHIVPRWIGDTNFMQVVGQVRVLPEMLDETWSKLSRRFELLQAP